MEQQGNLGDGEMPNLNDTVMPGLLNTVSNSVVAIIVKKKKKKESLVFSGIVLVSEPNFIYISTVSEIIYHIDNEDTDTIKVKTPNNKFITLALHNFYKDENHGTVGIRVDNPTPGEDYGFQHLEEIKFSAHGIQRQQVIYTYSINGIDGSPVRMLMPGSVILIEDKEESFDHNSAVYKFTHLGAPVLNVDGKLVGICYRYSGEEVAGYLSAYNAAMIVDEIESRQNRNFTDIAVALDHLRNEMVQGRL